MKGHVPAGSARNGTRLAAARDYISRGWQPVPIPSKSKSPKITAWQTLSVTEANVDQYFSDKGNIGIILGVDGMTDIDLDCAEAVTAGRHLLPPTGMVFGRVSKPSSHYCYMATPAAPMEKLLDPTDKKATICEFRCQKKDGGIGLQTVFPPSVHPSGEVIEFSRHGEPAAIDEVTLRQAFHRTAAAALLARHWPDAGAGRHETMLALAGVVARTGWPEEEALAFCNAVYLAVPTHDPAAVSRVRAEVADTYKAMAEDRSFTGFPTLRRNLKSGDVVVSAVSRWLRLSEPSEPDTHQEDEVDEQDSDVSQEEEKFPSDAAAEINGDDSGTKMSELGLSQCLLHRHSTDLRYAVLQRTWLCWNGRYWERDTTQTVLRYAIAIVRKMKIKNCKTATRMAGAVKLASADARVAITIERFDANDNLLNFRNGTLDLRTGELRSHCRRDLITKLIPFDYDPRAWAPRWERFLMEVFESYPDLLPWLQRAIGYSLTGDVREHCFFFMWGSGRNGKGVFINTLKLIFGAYAHQADFRAFAPKQGDGPLDAIANFKGHRIIVASESREGARFDESLMKTLTGGDPIRARLLYENSFEIKPTFKIWLASNYRPQIQGTDPAIWSRVRLIPFEVSFVGREDRNLQDALLAEAPGIIAWAVEGAARWREEGLEPLPQAVRMATESYRSESDVVGRFLKEEAMTGAQYSVPARKLYDAYAQWCVGADESAITEAAFGSSLRQRGVEKTRERNGNLYHGLTLRSRVGLV
jgi:putative DNA primase/helicase